MISTNKPWWQQSASELAECYRQGSLTPSEVIVDCFNRIEKINPELNAFVTLRRKLAIEEAKQSTQRFLLHKPLSLLDGIPIGIKDNILTADMPTSWGCVALRDYRPDVDELCMTQIRDAGGIIIGKTNVPEFTLEGYTSNPLHGTTRNPWNPRLTPGGSSGGSVAAVAAGLVPIALGTDGGGSTRRPASHTGLIGLKPSIGSIARGITLPPLLLDFEVIGLIARNVQDTRLMFDVLSVADSADRNSLAAHYRDEQFASEKLKIIYVDSINHSPVDPEISKSCLEGIEKLIELGHHVTRCNMPLNIDKVNQQWSMIGQTGLSWMFEQHPEWREGASEAFTDMANAGHRIPATDLWNLLQNVEELRREAALLFTQYDLLITPATAALPWPADSPFPVSITGQDVGPRGHAVFTGWVNAAGLPAIAIPTRPSEAGLPIGIQCIAGFGRDKALLEIASRLERHLSEPFKVPEPYQ